MKAKLSASSIAIAGFLADMDDDVHDIVAWSKAFQSFAHPPADIDYEVVMVMGKALNKAANRLLENWADAHALALQQDDAS